MRVRDIMTPYPVTVAPDTAVVDARRIMDDRRIRHLLVTADNRLLGIVTDRDIRLNLPSPATTLSIWELNYLVSKLTVGEVMTKSVLVVDPDRDAAEAAVLLVAEKIGALPVVHGGQLVGIVTETDFLVAFVTAAAAERAVKGG
jgi:acetoin utilization protein AcuB